MKKVLITLIILTALIISGVWIYLVIFGPSTKGVEVLTDFSNSLGGSTQNEQGAFDTGTNDSSLEEDTAPISLDVRLSQLTNKSVLGSVFVIDGDNTNVRFIERGTAHVYEVSLETGEVEKISNTTLPKSIDAVWAQSGTRVAIRREVSTTEGSWSVFSLQKNDIGLFFLEEDLLLPPESSNPSFDEVGDTLSYVHTTNTGSRGVAVDLKTNEERVTWSTPLRDIHALWYSKDHAYIYTAPSHEVRGFLYDTGNNFSRIGDGLVNLTAVTTFETVVLSGEEEEEYTSYNESGTPFGVIALREKCVYAPLDTDFLFCAAPFGLPQSTVVSEWYKGTASFNDKIWEINTVDGSALLLLDSEEELQISLDIDQIEVSAIEEYVLLRNKVDGTLWLYNRTI